MAIAIDHRPLRVKPADGEIGAGLENIFQLFRVVYFYRLTYRDHGLGWLGKWGGLRFGVYLDF